MSTPTPPNPFRAYTLFDMIWDNVRLAVMGACGYLGWWLGSQLNVALGALMFFLFSFFALMFFFETVEILYRRYILGGTENSGADADSAARTGRDGPTQSGSG